LVWDQSGSGMQQPLAATQKFGKMGSEPPSAPQKETQSRGCVNVGSHHWRALASHQQRMAAIRPSPLTKPTEPTKPARVWVLSVLSLGWSCASQVDRRSERHSKHIHLAWIEAKRANPPHRTVAPMPALRCVRQHRHQVQSQGRRGNSVSAGLSCRLHSGPPRLAAQGSPPRSGTGFTRYASLE